MGPNPVVDGLMKAFQLSNVVQNRRQQQQELELAKRREERQSRLQETELQMRLDTLGARPYTDSDGLEESSGVSIDLNSSMYGGVPTMSKSTIKNRVLKVGGNKYVLPTEDERELRADKRSERETKRKVAEVKATTGAREQEQTTAAQRRLDLLGVDVSPDMVKYAGLPAGRKIMPEYVDEAMRVVNAAKDDERKQNAPPPAPKMRSTVTDDSGNVTEVFDDGSTKSVGRIGKKTQPRAATGGERPLTAPQKKAEALAAKANEIFASTGGDATKAEEAIKKSSDPYVRSNAIALIGTVRKGATKANDESPEAMLQKMQTVLGGAAPAAPAPPPAPAAKPKKKISKAQLLQFQKAKGIKDFNSAVALAQKQGYEVN